MFGCRRGAHGWTVGPWIAYLGLAGVAYCSFGWFGTVIDESQRGLYNAGVDRSFRMGMMWFIFSEVMFFAAFLRHAVLRAAPVRAGGSAARARNSSPTCSCAGLRGRLADQRPGRRRRQFQTIPAFGLRRLTPRSC